MDERKALRVLIVDDEEHVLEGLDAVLGESCETTTCSEPQRALELARERQIDVLCADYSMPGMTGLELIERLAQEGRVIAAVLVTGRFEAYLEDARSRLARDGRPLAVLLKPCDPRELIRAVEHVGQFARMRRAIADMRRNLDRGT